MQQIEDKISTVTQGLSSHMSFHVTEEEGRSFIVASAHSPDDAREAASLSYRQIAEVLSERGLVAVHERIFGSLGVAHDVMSARTQAFTSFGISPGNAVTYIEGRPPWGEGLAGVIIHAVKSDEVWPVMDSGVPCGRGWRLNGATYLVLQNIQAFNGIIPGHRSKSLQARLMIEHAKRILRENGASYKDVVRTWFYLSGILDWYAAFNKVRNEKYGEFGIMPGPGDRDLLLPASTGIRGETPSGAASTMDLMAIVGKADRLAVKQLTNAAQLDAFRYGSAFSRGAIIQEPDVSLIEVSGTAAIDEHGVSLYPGDLRSQIDCTFGKIDSLLGQAGAGLADICAATVFVKRPEYAEVFREMTKDRGLEEFPAVCVISDVCRDELMFEIDGEAVVKK